MIAKTKADTYKEASTREHVLQARANETFKQAMRKAKLVKENICELGHGLARLQKNALWKHITDRQGHPRFRRWTEVANCIFGPMADRKCYELIACHLLTEGENPIAPEVVQQMGIKRAAELARLEPDERNPEIVKAAITEPLSIVRNKVQAQLNTKLPPSEQRPLLKLLAINLPEEYVKEFEEDMEVGIFMEGIRDGDDTQTMRQKVFHAMLIAFREYYAVELSEALKLMKAQAGVNDSPAAEAEDWSDQEDGFVVAAADEDAPSS